jgi:hypothetical protein
MDVNCSVQNETARDRLVMNVRDGLATERLTEGHPKDTAVPPPTFRGHAPIDASPSATPSDPGMTFANITKEVLPPQHG